MKKYSLPINLGVLVLLWFCLAFACKNNEPSRSPNDDGTTPTRRTGQNTGGDAITEQEVKDNITQYWTRNCRNFEECRVTFDSGVRINPLERHSFHNGITVDSYPVKVEFSSFVRNKTLEGDKGLWYRHRGGIYYFYRNSFKEWEYEEEGSTDTFDQ